MTARVTYVGHATVLIEIDGTRLLTDPVLRPGMLGMILRHADPPPASVTEAIDGVLISHLHHDHLDFRSLKRIDRATRVIVPLGAGRTLRRRGYGNATELAARERTTVGGLTVTATIAVHEGRRFKFGPRVEAAGYEIEGAGKRVYFAGDTDLFEEMGELAGRLDMALLPIAGWGPRLGPGHLNPVSAAEAAARIRPRVVVPIHWGTLIRRDIGRDPERAGQFLSEPVRRFEAELSERAPSVELRALLPGESLEL